MGREEALRANKNKYNECMKRRALIQSKYPNINDAPNSVQKEYFSIGTVAHAMRRAMNGDVTTKYVEKNDGVIIDDFQQESYELALKSVQEQSTLNKEVITEEMENEFVTPTINFDEVRQKIENCKSAIELAELDNEYIYSLKTGNFSFDEMQ